VPLDPLVKFVDPHRMLHCDALNSHDDLPVHKLRSPVPDEGVWAELKVGAHHLRLFSEHNAQDVQVSVYDVVGKKWIAPSEAVKDIERGKEKAVEYARKFLALCYDSALPPLVSKQSRTA
jgi:hypothetical protein